MAKFKCNICGQTFEADTMPDKCPFCQAGNENIEEIVEAGAQPSAPKKKGIDTNSNVYTILYAAVLVVMVAFLLAFVSSVLKPVSDANVEDDTKGQILTALGYDKTTIKVGQKFNEVVKDELFENGELKPYEGKFNTTYGQLIKDGQLHVFEATAANGEKAYVIPVTGRGLWGGLWGYIAVDETKTKVLGAYFYHESETAGLGARIGEREFQEQFIGRPIFNAHGEVALTVVKKGTGDKEFKVDGITGATLTSKGAGAMVTDGLKAYEGFLKAGIPSAPLEESTVCDSTDVKQ